MKLLITIIMLVASTSFATTHRIEFTSPYSQNQIAQVGILSGGVPLTSGVPTRLPGGTWYLDTHVMFGHETTIVLIDSHGGVSEPSNVQVWGGCLWDRSGLLPLVPDGIVGGPDWGLYLIEYTSGEAFFPEFYDFQVSYGLRCP